MKTNPSPRSSDHVSGHGRTSSAEITAKTGAGGEPGPRAGIRREPDPFRHAAVRRVDMITPYMARATLAGPGLRDIAMEHPASSVRLLLPTPGTTELPDVHWNGNEYLLEDGTRPIIRTFTPLNHDPHRGSLDLEIVLHDGGETSRWVRAARPGEPAAISGPGRGYQIDRSADSYLLLGDETALPAIRQLVDAIGDTEVVRLIVELRHPDARVEPAPRPGLVTEWVIQQPDEAPGASLLQAVRGLSMSPGTRVWAAGEAGAMHQLRRYLFDECGLDRGAATIRGYWKAGR